MYLGVDYYPEHWDLSLMDEDLKRIKEMGANIVRIGEFAWHLIEAAEGEFDFSFFDRVIEKLKANDLKVMFGTPTATFPAWLGNAYSDIYIVDQQGQKMSYGGRRQYCYNSLTYDFYSTRIVEKLVEHYADEATVISWQVDNELGHEGSDLCYCPRCHKQFQVFLEQKYKDIHNLNEIYGTIFWGQTYNHFSEIPMPLPTITVHNPSLQLDWARFRSYSLSQFAKKHVGLVRKHKGDHQSVTTNLPGGFFEKWFDHNEFSRDLDFVSYDNYPVWGGLTKPVPPSYLSMTLDYVRGLKQEKFWIVEQLMGAQGHDVIGYLPRPNQAKLWSYHAFAHGCSNMLYFRYRGMDRGAEQFCLGIIDANNKPSRKYKEVQAFMTEVSRYESIFNLPQNSQVAVLYDFDAVWSWRNQQQSTQFNFTNELMRLYKPFYDANVSIDVIRYDLDFSRYKVVILPVWILVNDELAQRIQDFVEQGGIVMTSFRAGMKDKHNRIPFGQSTPGKLSEVLGIEVEEAESLHEGQEVPVTMQQGNECTGNVWRDLVQVKGAEPLAYYGDHFSEYAAITSNQYGRGTAYYIGTGLSEAAMHSLVAPIIEETHLESVESPDGVEVSLRSDEGRLYAIVMNHNDLSLSYKGYELQPYSCTFYEIVEGSKWLELENR